MNGNGVIPQSVLDTMKKAHEDFQSEEVEAPPPYSFRPEQYAQAVGMTKGMGYRQLLEMWKQGKVKRISIRRVNHYYFEEDKLAHEARLKKDLGNLDDPERDPRMDEVKT